MRAEQRRGRGAVPAHLGAAAADAVADSIVREFRLPPGAIVSGYRPLADEFNPHPAMDRLAGRVRRSEGR